MLIEALEFFNTDSRSCNVDDTDPVLRRKAEQWTHRKPTLPPQVILFNLVMVDDEDAQPLLSFESSSSFDTVGTILDEDVISPWLSLTTKSSNNSSRMKQCKLFNSFTSLMSHFRGTYKVSNCFEDGTKISII